MKEIVEVADHERIFYLPDFIYFAQTIPYDHANALNAFLARILSLLVLFDRILIPAEHLTISLTEEQCKFKVRFLNHSSIQELIELKRIVTTIWSACSNVIEHIEAAERYKRTIEADYINSQEINCFLKRIKVFSRNQAKQSRSALDFAVRNGWAHDNPTTLLSYSDGKIHIPFSHESLLLGKGKKIFKDRTSISAAKLAYINAMPSGNGKIYRSLVPEIELVMGETFSANSGETLPPAFFSKENYENLLGKTGINSPFHRSSLLNRHWVSKFYELTELKSFSIFRDKVFEALSSLANQVEINNENTAKEHLKLIQFSRCTDLGIIGMRYYLNPLIMIPRFFESLRGTKQEFFTMIPSEPVKRINSLIEELKS